MPPATSSVKQGDRFKEGIVVKVFKDGAVLKAAGFQKLDDGAHVLLGRPADAGEPLTAGHVEFDFDGQRVIMHTDSAPHPVSWLHPA